MSKGWELNEGQVLYETISDDQIWNSISRVLSSQAKKTTSYKFVLLRSIIESLYKTNERLDISFAQLGESFAKVYWNLVIRNGYSQGHQAQIEKVLWMVKDSNSLPDGIPFDSISNEVQMTIIKAIEQKVLRKYVIGALYTDLNGVLYGFSKRDVCITLTHSGHEFLLKYQTTIFKLVNYELAKFLQKKNPLLVSGIILEEIENISKRESLLKFKQLLLDYSGDACFYTDRPLHNRKQNVSVDHFVPWSFVHSDELWNFVLTSATNNSSKGSKLPDEYYLQKIETRNRKLQRVGDVYVKKYMENYNFNHFIKLYNYAEINGFQKGWKPGV